MKSIAARRHDDEGQALIMALLIMGICSLVIFALLGQSEASLKTTSAVNSRSDRMYASDAGIEWAIQKLKLDPTICSAGGGATTLTGVPTFNSRSVTIKCTPQSGSVDLGAYGYAAIVNGTLTKQSGGDTIINGPTFVNGDISFNGNGGNLVVQNGNLLDKYASCPGGHTQPARAVVTPTPPYAWSCTTAATPDPAPVLPDGLGSFPLNPAPVLAGAGNKCTVFSPGKYTTKPALGADNYFVSGVYYFENIGELLLDNGTSVIGGQSATYGLSNLPGNCAGVTDANGSNASGSGVEWIFGGSTTPSTMQVKNATALELFNRTPAAAENATAGINIYAVATSAKGFVALPAGTKVLIANTGGAGMVVHGMIYAPTTNVDLFASNNTLLQVRNGVVTHDLALQASSVGSGLQLSVDTAQVIRGVLLTATAASANEGDVVADARVQIRDDTSPPTMVVQSWRTCAKVANAALPTPGCP